MNIVDIFFSFRTTEDIGRYYVFIHTIDGTSGDVYIEFHGDHFASSGEQHLQRSENFPDHPFASKHVVSRENLI